MSTVAAIATGSSPGGIGTIRLSGNEAFSIAEKVFFPLQTEKKLSQMAGYTAAFGEVRDEKGKLDEAVALVFRAPHSFTGEDTVELSVHGGAYVLSRVMAALLAAGARQAEAGEFTKRAFLNGKLDLSAAAAVSETVSARGEMQLRAAAARRDGVLCRRITALRETLTDLLAHIAAWCDFPEEGVEEVTQIEETLASVSLRLETLINEADTGLTVTSGVRAVLCGKPNVGKSTLMNLLCGGERSIVTDVPGTTRDVVEATVSLGGITLNLADTAGLRETDDAIERLGVTQSRRRISEAGLLFAVFDGSRAKEEEDEALLAQTAHRPSLVLINKADCGVHPDFENIDGVRLYATEEQSRRLITEKITELLNLRGTDLDGGLLSSERELSAAQEAKRAVNEAREALANGVTLDAVAVCLEDAAAALGQITGETVSESVIEKVFAQFCVGK